MLGQPVTLQLTGSVVHTYRQSNPLEPSDRTKITPEDYLIKLRVFDVKRADSGDYTLTAENRNGRDTHTVRVNVMGELMRGVGSVSDRC